MKSCIAALCATLAATGCQAWAPAVGFASRMATKPVGQRNNYFEIRRAPTSIYATVEDEQKAEANVPSNETDTVSDSFNKDESEDAMTFFSPIPYSELTIGIIKETFKGENRVSQTPDSVAGLVKAGFTVIVESGGTIYCHQIELNFVVSFERNCTNIFIIRLFSIFYSCQLETVHLSAILYTPKPALLFCRMLIKYSKTPILSPRFVLQTTTKYPSFVARPCSA